MPCRIHLNEAPQRQLTSVRSSACLQPPPHFPSGDMAPQHHSASLCNAAWARSSDAALACLWDFCVTTHSQYFQFALDRQCFTPNRKKKMKKSARMFPLGISHLVSHWHRQSNHPPCRLTKPEYRPGQYRPVSSSSSPGMK